MKVNFSLNVRRSLGTLLPIIALLVIALPDRCLALRNGPDAFGYTAIDGAEVDGPQFSFQDISGTGTRVTFFDADALPTQNANADDGVALSIPLTTLNGGQGFPFYNQFFSSVNMSTNGFLHFLLNGTSDSLSNSCPIQNAVEPNQMIAVYWDDLVLRNPPSVLAGGYFQEFSPCPYDSGGTDNCVVFQWDNADHFGGGIDSFDFQAVLYESGNILMLYPEGEGATPTNPPFNPEHGAGSTTGLENSDASIGLTQVCDTNNSIPANHAILFVYPGPTISLKETVAACVPDPSDPHDPTCVQQCGTAESLVVPPGTAVQYCYKVENIGPIPATKHTLVDNQFGIILLDFPFTVPSLGSAFITRKHTVTQNLVNVGTWTAKGPVNTGTATDTVTVLIDTDADGIADINDNCLTSSNAGQEDTDGDGTGDSCEFCPNDPAKTVAGECGCGTADLDANSNGIIDCKTGNELAFKLNLARLELEKIKLRNGEFTARSRAAKTALRNLVSEIQTFASQSGPTIQVKSGSPSLSTLVTRFRRSMLTMIKASKEEFPTSRGLAVKNLSNLRRALVLS